MARPCESGQPLRLHVCTPLLWRGRAAVEPSRHSVEAPQLLAYHPARTDVLNLEKTMSIYTQKIDRLGTREVGVMGTRLLKGIDFTTQVVWDFYNTCYGRFQGCAAATVWSCVRRYLMTLAATEVSERWVEGGNRLRVVAVAAAVLSRRRCRLCRRKGRGEWQPDSEEA